MVSLRICMNLGFELVIFRVKPVLAFIRSLERLRYK